MRRRVVPIWQNSSLLEHLPSDLLHGDKQVANKELVVMEKQGMQTPCCFQRVANANTNTRTNTKSWLWRETRKCSAALFSKGNPPPPRGKCMLRWLAPLSHKYKALLSDKYKRHCLCHKCNALLGQILQNDLFVTQTEIRGKREWLDF